MLKCAIVSRSEGQQTERQQCASEAAASEAAVRACSFASSGLAAGTFLFPPPPLPLGADIYAGPRLVQPICTAVWASSVQTSGPISAGFGSVGQCGTGVPVSVSSSLVFFFF